ncbi:MAG: hypothetical protein EB084_06460 [Proteobacteria bacterium]|nr:hypothetical protein [Pseudomonadota bacterium]
MRVFLLFSLLLFSAAAAAFGAPSDGQIAHDCATMRSFPPQVMGVRVEGGKQGRVDIYAVDLKSGEACILAGGRRSHLRLTAPELARLRSAVEGSGFFGWRERYAPANRGADRLSTTVIFNDGKQSHRVTVTGPAAPPKGFAELARRFELLAYAPYWHDPDYQAVTGRLERVQLEGGFWTLVYASGADAKADKHGGRFVLDVDRAALQGFKSGDLVLVTGAVTPDVMGIQMAGPHYAAKRVERLR